MRHFLLSLCVTACLGVSALPAQEKKFLGKTAESWSFLLRDANSDAKTRRNAAFALGKMGPAVSGRLGGMKAVYLKEPDVKVREAIVFAMASICSEGAGEDLGLDKLFIGALTEADPHLRRSAAYALGSLKPRTDEMRDALDNAIKNDKRAAESRSK